MADSKKKKSSPLDKVKDGVIGVAKEVTGVNDFKKAGDAFKRADETSKKIDYSGGFKSDAKNVGEALPSYVKDIAVGVGDAALGGLKAASLLTPFGRSKKAADAASGALIPKVTPKPPTGGSGYPINPGPQFKPQGTSGTLKTKTQPKTSWAPQYKTKPKTTPKSTKPSASSPQFKTQQPVEPAFKTNPQGQTSPKLETKMPPKKIAPITTGVGAGLLAGAILKPEKKEPGTWNPSAIV
jgi:hypothetical protein